MAYEYDYLLKDHFKSAGILGMAGGAAKGAFNFGKGALGFGGKGLMGGLGTAAGVAAPVAGMLSSGNTKPGFVNPFTGTKTSSIIHPLVDLAGLGMLGIRPAHHLIHSQDPEERTDAKYELAGLGTLAAPSAIDVGKSAVGKIRSLLHR